MKEKKEFDWFDHPKNIKRLKTGFFIVLVLLVLPDFCMHKHTLFSLSKPGRASMPSSDLSLAS